MSLLDQYKSKIIELATNDLAEDDREEILPVINSDPECGQFYQDLQLSHNALKQQIERIDNLPTGDTSHFHFKLKTQLAQINQTKRTHKTRKRQQKQNYRLVYSIILSALAIGVVTIPLWKNPNRLGSNNPAPNHSEMTKRMDHLQHLQKSWVKIRSLDQLDQSNTIYNGFDNQTTPIKQKKTPKAVNYQDFFWKNLRQNQ